VGQRCDAALPVGAGGVSTVTGGLGSVAASAVRTAVAREAGAAVVVAAVSALGPCLQAASNHRTRAPEVTQGKAPRRVVRVLREAPRFGFARTSADISLTVLSANRKCLGSCPWHGTRAGASDGLASVESGVKLLVFGDGLEPEAHHGVRKRRNACAIPLPARRARPTPRRRRSAAGPMAGDLAELAEAASWAASSAREWLGRLPSR
jgi:hypothetical protein